MSKALNALAQNWRHEAENLRTRYADDRMAAVCEAHATELESLIRNRLEEELSIKEAARICGYSYSHLRRLLDAGEIANVGGEGRPRVRLGDLPFKAGRAAPLGAVNAAKRAHARTKASGKVRPIG